MVVQKCKSFFSLSHNVSWVYYKYFRFTNPFNNQNIENFFFIRYLGDTLPTKFIDFRSYQFYFEIERLDLWYVNYAERNRENIVNSNVNVIRMYLSINLLFICALRKCTVCWKIEEQCNTCDMYIHVCHTPLTFNVYAICLILSPSSPLVECRFEISLMKSHTTYFFSLRFRWLFSWGFFTFCFLHFTLLVSLTLESFTHLTN